MIRRALLSLALLVAVPAAAAEPCGLGLGGQRLFAVPALDLVVAISSAHCTGPLQGIIPLAILNRVVLPAIRE